MHSKRIFNLKPDLSLGVLRMGPWDICLVMGTRSDTNTGQVLPPKYGSIHQVMDS